MSDFTIDNARKIVKDEYSDCEIVAEGITGSNSYFFDMRPKDGKNFTLTIDARDRFPLVVPVD